MKTKKLNIRIDSNLLEKLTRYAATKGLSKNKILILWLQQADYSEVFVKANTLNHSKQNLVINIPQDIYEKTLATSKKHNLNLTLFITLIILNNLETSKLQAPRETESFNINNLWAEGNIKSLIKTAETKVDSLDADSYLLYLSAVAEHGSTNKTQSAINYFNERFRTINTLQNLKLELNKAELQFNLRNLNEADRIINQVIANPLTFNDREIIAKALILKGDISYIKDSHEKAIYYFTQATEFLDIINYPNELARAYLKIARMNCMLLNNQTAVFFLENAYRVIERTQNIFLKGCYQYENAAISFSFGNLENALNSIDESISYMSIAGTGSSLLYPAYHFRGRILLSIGNEQAAHSQLRMAEEIEDKVRLSQQYCYSKVYKYHIEARHNPERAIESINKVMALNTKDGLVPELLSHLRSAINYLYGRNEKERTEAELALKSIVKNKSYPLISQASEGILANKILQPVR